MYTILELGTKVIIGDKIEGFVNGVGIYLNGNISYEVIYWHEGKRQSVWVGSTEMSSPNERNTKINFKPLRQHGDHNP